MNRRNFIRIATVMVAIMALESHSLLAADIKSDQSSKSDPFIKGIHHLGISTSDLDRSLSFYGELMGIEILGKGPFEGEAYTKITALEHARGRMAMLRVGDTYIEIFEYERSKGEKRKSNRPVDELGFNHLCFEVDDVQKEYQRLKQAGVDFHSPPQVFGTAKAVYGRDPDGNVFELVEW